MAVVDVRVGQEACTHYSPHFQDPRGISTFPVWKAGKVLYQWRTADLPAPEKAQSLQCRRSRSSVRLQRVALPELPCLLGGQIWTDQE